MRPPVLAQRISSGNVWQISHPTCRIAQNSLNQDVPWKLMKICHVKTIYTILEIQKSSKGTCENVQKRIQYWSVVGWRKRPLTVLGASAEWFVSCCSWRIRALWHWIYRHFCEHSMWQTTADVFRAARNHWWNPCSLAQDWTWARLFEYGMWHCGWFFFQVAVAKTGFCWSLCFWMTASCRNGNDAMDVSHLALRKFGRGEQHVWICRELRIGPGFGVGFLKTQKQRDVGMGWKL